VESEHHQDAARAQLDPRRPATANVPGKAGMLGTTRDFSGLFQACKGSTICRLWRSFKELEDLRVQLESAGRGSRGWTLIRSPAILPRPADSTSEAAERTTPRRDDHATDEPGADEAAADDDELDAGLRATPYSRIGPRRGSADDQFLMRPRPPRREPAVRGPRKEPPPLERISKIALPPPAWVPPPRSWSGGFAKDGLQINGEGGPRWARNSPHATGFTLDGPPGTPACHQG